MYIRDRKYYIDNVLSKLDKKQYVMCGVSSMCYNGMSVCCIFQPEVFTEYEELVELRLEGYISYYYNDNIDYVNYVTPLEEVPNILVPSKERAIIECIKFDLRFIDEGYFCDTLERYQNSGDGYDRSLLEEVANHFNVPMSKVDYWLEESSDYNSY